MLNKSKLLVLTLVVSVLLPQAVLADEASSGCKKPSDLLSWTIGMPFKAVGATLASSTGLLVGTTTGLIRGAVKGTKAVAGALGDEDGAVESIAGIALGAAPGAAIHGLLGGLQWGTKGFIEGWGKPFSCQSIQSALEGIPDAIEWTADHASKAFSS